jgi:hypothetical protein
MNYEHFEILFDNWQAFQRSVHTLSPCHPLKKFYKSLMDKIRELPVEKQEEYFTQYFKEREKED